jgi:hypothetical protein
LTEVFSMYFEDAKVLLIDGRFSLVSALIGHLSQQRPALIRVLSRDEYQQFRVSNLETAKPTVLQALIGDSRDRERLTEVMRGMDYVFDLDLTDMDHRAASCRPSAIAESIVRKENLVAAAARAGVDKLLLISGRLTGGGRLKRGIAGSAVERMIIAAGSGLPVKVAGVRVGESLDDAAEARHLFRGWQGRLHNHLRQFVTDLFLAHQLSVVMALCSPGSLFFSATLYFDLRLLKEEIMRLPVRPSLDLLLSTDLSGSFSPLPKRIVRRSAASEGADSESSCRLIGQPLSPDRMISLLMRRSLLKQDQSGAWHLSVTDASFRSLV